MTTKEKYTMFQTNHCIRKWLDDLLNYQKMSYTFSLVLLRTYTMDIYLIIIQAHDNQHVVDRGLELITVCGLHFDYEVCNTHDVESI